MDVASITPLILTFDEAPNIARTLARLGWATRIVVVDSGSTDGTLDILRDHPAVEVFHREFDDHAAQWNFGLRKIDTEWVLALDADYELSDELVGELAALAPSDPISGYDAQFVYRIAGRPLRGALYPPHTVLYRRQCGSYRNEGHTQRLNLSGPTQPLSGAIYHDDRKPLRRWFKSQQRYAELEADFLLSLPPATLRMNERIRLMAWPAPFLVFFYTLLFKGCFLDGRAGWLYVLQRTCAEIMIAIELIDRRLRGASPQDR